jgi:hypothetical protein
LKSLNLKEKTSKDLTAKLLRTETRKTGLVLKLQKQRNSVEKEKASESKRISKAESREKNEKARVGKKKGPSRVEELVVMSFTCTVMLGNGAQSV